MYILLKIVIFYVLLQITAKSDVYSKRPNIISGLLFLVFMIMILDPKVMRYMKQKILKITWKNPKKLSKKDNVKIIIITSYGITL